MFIPRPAYAADITPGTPPPSSTATTTTIPAAGPLGAKILTEEASLESMGQQVQVLQESVAADQVLTNTAYEAWQNAVAVQTTAQDSVAAAAAKAYEDQQQLGPYGQYSDTIRGLGMIAPGLVRPPANGEAAAVDLTQARLAATNAYNTYSQALMSQQELQTQADDLQASFTKKTDSLNKLKAKNQLAVAEAQAAQAATDSSIGAGLGAGASVNGMAAAPRALGAVQYALNQIGKPYVFGAEGPNSFDCSGLTWAAYRSVGITIPRIARYQEHGLTPINVSELLPGDLIFFSGTNGSSWTSVSHVGMYYGRSANGTALMIEAPYTGADVKIAPVWWSHYFSAARVVPAVPAPPGTSASTPAPTPTKTPKPTPTLKPTPTKSPSPKPTPTKSPSPTPKSPSPTPKSPSPTPKSPSPTPKSPSPTPSNSPSPPASSSPSASTAAASPSASKADQTTVEPSTSSTTSAP